MAQDLSRFADLADVRSVVIGDSSGLFIDARNEPDGESVAAIMGSVSTTLGEAGEQLGLGPLRRVSLLGGGRCLIVTIHAGAVITAFVDAGRSLATVEKRIDTALRR